MKNSKPALHRLTFLSPAVTEHEHKSTIQLAPPASRVYMNHSRRTLYPAYVRRQPTDPAKAPLRKKAHLNSRIGTAAARPMEATRIRSRHLQHRSCHLDSRLSSLPTQLNVRSSIKKKLFARCLTKTSFATRKHSRSTLRPASDPWRGTVQRPSAIEYPSAKKTTKSSGYVKLGTSSCGRELDFCLAPGLLNAPTFPFSDAATIRPSSLSEPLRVVVT